MDAGRLTASASPVNKSPSRSAIHEFVRSRLQGTPAGTHFCGLNDGFDGCLYDPAARQFQQNVVADFMFAHLSTLLDGITAGRFKTCIKAVSLVNGLFGSFE
jgi:hypothetical protein